MKPLEGLRVLDLTRMFAGPFATMLLADMGAEVIKVEEPRVGDPTRRNLPMIGDESAYFISVNRGKRSLAVDLKTPEGLEIVSRLVEHSDVVIENFRPGTMDKLGLGYERLKALNPDVVYCAISGFGMDGPMRSRTSFDLINQAIAGIMDLTGNPDGRPVRIGPPLGDLSGGLYAVIAVLSALVDDRPNRGCQVDLALHDCLIELLGYAAQFYFVSGENPERVGSAHHSIAPYRIFDTSDGSIAVCAFTQDYWRKLLNAIDAPELAEKPTFATVASRKEHHLELDDVLEPIFASRRRDEWLAVLTANDVPCAPVLGLAEVINSDLTAERGMIMTMQHSSVGEVRVLNSALRGNGDVWVADRPAPVLGEHTAEILAELARAALAPAAVPGDRSSA